MPYKSEAQRRKFHALLAEGKIKQEVVDEFDKASEGLVLPDRIKKAFAELAPEDRKALAQKRFSTYADLLRNKGVYAGTFHKRVLIPKSKLNEDDLKGLGFESVLAAIPEAGQDQFRSYRHPDNLFHIHSHNDNWTMHEDRHPSSTMLSRKIGPVRAFIQGAPHIITEGVPGLAAYVAGQFNRRRSTADRVSDELGQETRDELQKVSEAAPESLYDRIKKTSPVPVEDNVSDMFDDVGFGAYVPSQKGIWLASELDTPDAPSKFLDALGLYNDRQATLDHFKPYVAAHEIGHAKWHAHPLGRVLGGHNAYMASQHWAPTALSVGAGALAPTRTMRALGVLGGAAIHGLAPLHEFMADYHATKTLRGMGVPNDVLGNLAGGFGVNNFASTSGPMLSALGYGAAAMVGRELYDHFKARNEQRANEAGQQKVSVCQFPCARFTR